MRRIFSSTSYWLQLLSNEIPSRRYRNPNKLLSFGEATLAKHFHVGKMGFGPKCEVKKKYRLEKGINQGDPPPTGIHPEYWIFSNNREFTKVNLDYNFSMTNTRQVIIKDNEFFFSEYKERNSKRYQIYPLIILRIRHPEMSNLSELQYEQLKNGCARALKLFNNKVGRKPEIRLTFPYVTLDQLIAEPEGY